MSESTTCRLALAVLALFAAGCSPDTDGGGDRRAIEGGSVRAPGGRASVVFQTDWYPQPEHGGFYQALERGFYSDAGLDVTILPGGPRALVLQKVGMGQVPLAVWRSDDVTVAVSRGVPLQCLAGIYQKSAQALMFHASHPVESVDDLRGRVVMAGAASVWVQLVEKRHGIEFQRTPLSFSIAQFLEDPLLVQQCMVTSEPFLATQAGAEVGTLMLDEIGSEPYHVIVGNREWVGANPGLAAAFVRASIRGWRDYLEGDPVPAFATIARLNPLHNDASMAFSREATIKNHLITGDRPGQRIGALDHARLEAQATLLFELGIAERPVSAEELVAPGFPPDE